MTVRFLPAGDTALVIEFGDRIDRALSNRVLQLSRQIGHAALPGVVETMPTFRSLMVHYDPLITGAETLRHAIGGLLGQPNARAGGGRLWRLPACYAPSLAPDLQAVAERTGIPVEGVVARHSGTLFHVYMIGFTPGYPYMGDLPVELHLPRREDPRTRVPAGSIAIAASLSAVYPSESPGGWHLIGATPVRLFDPGSERPSLLGPGDAVRFEPIELDEFAAFAAEAEVRTAALVPEEIPE